MLWNATEVMELYCVSIEVDFCFWLQKERLCKTDLRGLKLSVSIANPCSKLLWRRTSSLCLFLYWVLVSKQSKTNFALLGIEHNQVKGVEASSVKSEAQKTMLFHCLFGLRCCSKLHLTLLNVNALFLVIYFLFLAV